MLKSAPMLALAALGALVGVPAAATLAALPGAAPVVFQAPANRTPAGPAGFGDRFGRVLPSGRLLHPSGESVVTGMNAQGVALAPSGRFVIVSNDDALQAQASSALDPDTKGGFSLVVVDAVTMAIVSRYTSPDLSLFAGIVAVPDPLDPSNTLVFAAGGRSNAVFVFDLDAAGVLSPDAHPRIDIPGGSDAQFADAGRSFPGSLVAGPTGTTVYVLDNQSDDVAQIDVATRALAGERVPVGYFPFGAAATRTSLLVLNSGLSRARVLSAPQSAPPFAPVAPDLARASSLQIVDAAPDGSLSAASSRTVPLDRAPDGTIVAGGASPSAVVAMKSKPYAFVAMGNLDRIATVSLGGAAPFVAGGTELRLFDRGPYGTQPVALALDRGERRLYVALAGIDAIAILDTRDPLHLHRVGLIPTGWYPAALALSRDGRYLFVANAKGIGHDAGFTGDRAASIDPIGRVQVVNEDASAEWSTLERIDLAKVDVRRSTPLALSSLRAIARARRDPIVPQRFGSTGSAAIKHVVCIVTASATYDALLGDLTDAAGAPYGKGDPAYDAYDSSLTPNLHALARTYALAANFYADADQPDLAGDLATAAGTSTSTQRMARARFDATLRANVASHSEDPEDAPRNGSIFTALARRGESYRDYGGLLHVSGSADGAYPLDVPAPLVLGGHVDLAYAGADRHATNVARAAEFVRDFDTLEKTGAIPAFTYLWLPAPRDPAAGAADVSAAVADSDSALGSIVDYLSHLPEWSSTAVFVEPGDSLGARDHVDPSRSYALVISPFAKHHVTSQRHFSTASVLKTEEEILGLPALSLDDALASDMSDLFTTQPDPTPFTSSR